MRKDSDGESMRKNGGKQQKKKMLSHRKKTVMASGEILTAFKTVFSQQAFS